MSLSNPTHLMLNLSGCNKEKLMDEKFINEIMNNLPSSIGMTLIREANSLVYESEHLDSGITSFSILAESHCATHSFVDRGGFLFLDVFSCGKFDTDRATAMLVEAFEAKRYKSWIIDRGEYFDNFEAEAEIETYDNQEGRTLDSLSQEDAKDQPAS